MSNRPQTRSQSKLSKETDIAIKNPRRSRSNSRSVTKPKRSCTPHSSSLPPAINTDISLTDSDSDEVFEKTPITIPNRKLDDSFRRLSIDLLKEADSLFESIKTSLFRSTKMADIELKDIPSIVRETIPIFNGSESTSDIHYIIDQCHEINKNYKDFPDILNKFKTEIKNRIRGEAYELVRDTTITKLEDLIIFFTSNFLPSVTVHEIENQLRNIYQLRDESVTQFAKRLSRLSQDFQHLYKQEYKQDHCAAYIEKQKKTLFLNGLNDVDLKRHLISSKEQDFRNLIKLAEELDTHKSPQQHPKDTQNHKQNTPFDNTHNKHSYTNNQNHPQPHKPQTQRNYHNQVINNTTSNLPNYQRIKQEPDTNIFCNYCKTPGHTIPECEERARRHGPYQQQNFQPSQHSHTQPQFNRYNYTRHQQHNNTQRYNQHNARQIQPTQYTNQRQQVYNNTQPQRTYRPQYTEYQQTNQNATQYLPHSQPTQANNIIKSEATEQFEDRNMLHFSAQLSQPSHQPNLPLNSENDSGSAM